MGSTLWHIPGQQRAVTALAAAARRGEVGHAVAFLGPAEVGQTAAARALAATLFCAAAPQERPCGACSACRRAAAGTHPDFAELAPTGAAHRVEDVRERWLHAASRSPAEAGGKVLRVLEADRLTDAAANAVLKSLEEPPAGTVWVLDVIDPDALPETILSRCRCVRFSALGLDELTALAAELGVDAPEQALAARVAGGVPATVRRLAAPGGLAALRGHRGLVGRLRSEGPGAALVAAHELEKEARERAAALREEAKDELETLDRAHGGQLPAAIRRQHEERTSRRERELRTAALRDALDDLLSWLRDCALVAAGGATTEAVHADAGRELVDDAGALGVSGALRAADLVLAAREGLDENLQPQLTLEHLLLEVAALLRLAAAPQTT